MAGGTGYEEQGSAAPGLTLFGAEYGKFYARGVKNNSDLNGKQSGKGNIAAGLKCHYWLKRVTNQQTSQKMNRDPENETGPW